MNRKGYKVYIIGMGPGAPGYLSPVAEREIERADCLIGARRHIAPFRKLGKEEVPVEGHFSEVIPYIKKHKGARRLAILVSGDPGMYSLLNMVSKVLKPEEYTVIPGISAVQLAFARIGESWHDAEIISLHGRKADDLADKVMASPKAFIFTDPALPPNRIAANLLKEGIENRRAVVLENLSYPDERILDTDLRRLSRIRRRFGLCAMIIERYTQKAKKGKLYGIGIGPGDPGLVTLKAKEILDRVDTVFVPKASEDGESVARSIVEAVTEVKKSFVELTFPMTKDKELLKAYWLRSARRIAKEMGNRREAAFVTIGDPFIYSTYVYLFKTLRRHFPNVEIETVPGISAFSAAASSAGLPLVEGNERMAVVPVRHDLRGVKEALERFDTVILMKVGSKLDSVISLLKEMGLGRKAILISRVGHSDEKIVHNLSALKDSRCGYLSVIIVKKGWK